MEASLYYLDWERIDARDRIELLFDNGRPEYVAFAIAAWGFGYYTKVAQLPEELSVQLESTGVERTLGLIWKWFNRGSGYEHPLLDQLRLRSLSVGDVVLLETDRWLCRSIGWEKME